MPEPLLNEKQRPLFERLVRVTVQVEKGATDRSEAYIGSGVVLTECGLILTAAHVVKRARVVTVRRLHLDEKRWRIWKYGKYKADVIYRDKRADVAVLKMRKPPKELPSIPLGNSDAVSVGWPLYRAGRDRIPLGAGYVYAIQRHRKTMTEFAVGMDANSAASGGPVVNDSGELVGICLESERYELRPPSAFVLTLSDIQRRILRRKEVREHLDPETWEAICTSR